MAAAIDRSEDPSLEDFGRLYGDVGTQHILGGCDTASLRDLVLVRLKEVDLAYEAADPERANRAGEAAEVAIRRSLSCSPLDGNHWLKLAMLQIARSGPSPAAFDYIRLSQWIAPSEGRIVRSRVDLLSQLFAAGVKEVESELLSDIRTLVRFDAPTSVAAMYSASPQAVRPLYSEWIALLPSERKMRVESALEQRENSTSTR